METELTVGELAIVVVAHNHNPSILNPDFLRINEIVPEEWRVAETMTLAPIARVVFEEGITITAEMPRLVITEDLLDRSLDDSVAARIAGRYVDVLPHVKYDSVGINPRGHVEAESEQEAQGYVAGRFFSQGPWSEFGESEAVATVSLRYTLAQGNFVLNIESGFLGQPDDSTDNKPVLFFAGNRHRDVVDDGGAVHQIHSILDDWRADVDAFTDFAERIVA